MNLYHIIVNVYSRDIAFVYIKQYQRCPIHIYSICSSIQHCLTSPNPCPRHFIRMPRKYILSFLQMTALHLTYTFSCDDALSTCWPIGAWMLTHSDLSRERHRKFTMYVGFCTVCQSLSVAVAMMMDNVVLIKHTFNISRRLHKPWDQGCMVWFGLFDFEPTLSLVW